MNNTNVNWVEFKGQIYREDHKPAPFTSIEGKHYPDYHDGLVSVAYSEGDRALIAAAPTMFYYLQMLAEGGDDKAHAIIKKITGL